MSDPPAATPKPSENRRPVGLILNIALGLWFLFLAALSGIFQMTTDACYDDCERVESIVGIGIQGVILGLLVLFLLGTRKAWDHPDLKGTVLTLLVTAALGVAVLIAGGVFVGMLVDL